MRKSRFTLLLMLLGLGAVSLSAQNAAYTLYFEQPDSLPCTDEEFCIDLTVEDFTNILETRFNVVWDSTVIEFVGVNNVIDELSSTIFTEINSGTLNINWQEGGCSDPGSVDIVTLDDCTGQCRPTIFSLCFRTVSNYGEATEVTVAESPAPYAAKDFSGCNNVFLIPKPATVSTCVRPFLIDISDGQGNEGDLVCLDFYGSGIDALTSFQFPIVWDSTKASFENIIVADNLPNLTQNDFGRPGQAAGVQPGSVTVAWNGPPPTNIATVPDSTLLFQLCLRLKDGACGTDFEVLIADQQPGQPFFMPIASNDDQTVDPDGFGEIAVGSDPGEISVGDCDPEGIKVVADCGAPVMLNDPICVQITAGDNFVDVNALEFLMEWNASLMEYTNVQGFNLPGLNAGSFNVANVGNGVIGVEWSGGAQTRAEGEVLFEVCYDVTGLGGNSPFTFVNNDNDVARVQGNPANIGINPSNCEVVIEQPDGVVIDVTEGLEGRPGDTLCFDFMVSNFNELERLQFSINWETSNLEFLFPSGFQNLNASAGVTLANFGTLGWPSGFIPFTWEAPSGSATLADGEVLFTLCFRVPDDGVPGTCDQMLITGDPLSAEAVSANSNGEDIGVTGINGNYCIISPEGFWLVPDNITGDLRDTVCMPFKVGEFEDITEANFTVNWPPDNVELIDIVDPGVIPGLNINLGGSPVGATTFDFTEAAGLTLADSTVIFEMCFELIGPADTCYAMNISDGAIVNTLNGTGSLLDQPSQICIDNKIFIDSVIITPETCPGLSDGAVRLIVSGGNPEILDGYGFSWTNPTRVSNPAENLPSGEVIVTVFDGIGLSVTDTIFVPTGGLDLSIDAGPDQVANCDSDNMPNFISPTVSPMGEPSLSYQWTASNGGQVLSNPNDRIGLLGGPGTFTIAVIDTNGCSASDTLMLTEPVLPTLTFVNDTPDTLNCVRDMVGLGVEEVADVTYEWTGPNSFTASTPTVMAQDSGTYFVTLTFNTTMCSSTDSIRVDIDTIPPTVLANPGVDTLDLGCNDVATLVGLVDGANINNFDVRWLDDSGTELTTDPEYMTNIPGQYFFEATDLATGCTNIDSVIVSPESSLPVVNIQSDPAPVINCNFDPVQLTTTVENAEPDGVTVEWTASNGGTLTPGTENLLSPEATTSGTYSITITENATGCTASDMIEVVLDTVPVAVSTEVVGQIDCNNETATLDGSGSAAGPDITYSWFSLQFNTVVGEAATLPVGSGGLYVLTVRDTVSGCSNTDTVMVMVDTLKPEITLGPGSRITCPQDTVPVSISVNLPASDYMVNWAGDAPIAEVLGDTVARFDQEGTYIATVTNLITGCADTISRTIEDVRFEPELVLAEDSLFLNCYGNSVIIDATASSQSDTFNTFTYQWNIIDGDALPPFNENELETEVGGVFEFVVTEVLSNCTTRDTAYVTSDIDPPTAVVQNPLVQSLTCLDNAATLDGTGSSTGDNFVYFWQRLDPGGTVTDTIASGAPEDVTMVMVSSPGNYQLRIFDLDNGCIATSQQTQVTLTGGEPPQIVFGAPTDIGVIDLLCDTPDTLGVNFSLANDTLFQTSNLTFEWTGNTEVITDDMDPFSVSFANIMGADTLTLMVTDTTTGCMGENEIVINDEREFPTAIIEEDSLTLNCDITSLVLDGTASTQGDTIAYRWLYEQGGAAIGDADTLFAPSAGTYTLVVENTLNACTAEDSIQVGRDIQVPMVVTETPAPFQCNTETITLSAEPTGDAADFEALWIASSGGNIVPNPGTLTADVDGPGFYSLTLTSNLNGCDTTVLLEVLADTMPPMGMIAAPDLLGCEGQTVTLDATTFGNNGDFDILWESTDGGNVSPATGSLLVDVDAAGTYTVTVTSLQNGCEATASVTVELDPNIPEAVGTAPDNVLGCGETLTLDGTGSSEGTVFDYEWIALNNGTPPMPQTNLTATVMEVGDYIFIVTNMETGCADTSEVVTIVPDDALPEAMAQVDSVSCDGTAFISANLPEGTTGMWEALGTATVTDPTSNVTTATNLALGANEFTWTLSQEGCPDFSSSSITVLPELAPDAQDDIVTIGEGSNGTTFNLLGNDDLTGVSDFTVEIVSDPNLGTLINNGDGEFGYTLDVPLFSPAIDGFTYQLCNANCPTLCSEAMVEINVERDTTIETTVANGITPNGDGMNDELIFDELLLNPDKYPDNSLIVFNRWGDIVYESQPYNNDWTGTNADGSQLPDGTYYYILRLEIGSGNIIRGDITIIR